MSRTIRSRTQKDILNDKYKTFLAKNGKPKTIFSNPLNLFDESNSQDRIWMTIAKKYLSRQRKI